jgi:type I restriction enzyme M protein
VKLDAPMRKAILSALSERDETAEVCKDGKANVESDPDLRDYENVPLKEGIETYFEREVRPQVPDAWVDVSKTKVGYEIPLTRHFYRPLAIRPPEEIKAEILTLERQTAHLLSVLFAED